MTKIVFTVLAVVLLVGCGSRELETPKPRGYFRIEYPAHSYQVYDSLEPFRFEYPTYSLLVSDTDLVLRRYWFNIEFPSQKATLHMSYKTINDDILALLEDSRSLVYKHTVKAESIDEKLIMDPKKRKFGMYYIIKGDAASSFQFVVTDSTRHFLRGALYFNVVPNKDSLAPTLAFIRQDVEHFVQSLEWKE